MRASSIPAVPKSHQALTKALIALRFLRRSGATEAAAEKTERPDVDGVSTACAAQKITPKPFRDNGTNASLTSFHIFQGRRPAFPRRAGAWKKIPDPCDGGCIATPHFIILVTGADGFGQAFAL
jgi:hypothetical protein